MGRKKRSNPFVAWLRLGLMLVVLVGGFLASRSLPSRLPSHSARGTVVVQLERVVDGDTAWFRDSGGREIKARFIGIDAPESGSAAYFRSGLAAAELLEQASSITLEPEPSKPEDRHGRMLAWVWLEMPDGSRLLLQEEMMRQGFAELFRDARGSLYFNRLEEISGR